MNLLDECRQLSDAELENNLKFLAEREKHNLAKLIAHIAEYDRRQLCVKRGHSTLFHYCLKTLGYDEGGAYRRIRAARVARRWPEILERLEKGALHLTALIVLAPILNDMNRAELFRLAEGRSRRELEALVAERLPRAPQADMARRLPVPGGWSLAVSSPVRAVEAVPDAAAVAAPPGGETGGGDPLRPHSAAAPGPEASAPFSRPWEWQAMVPISVDRVRIGFDAGIAVMSLIDRARQILRHKYPAGRLEDLVKEALELLLDRKDPQRRLTLKPAQAVRDAAALPADAPRFLRARAAGRYIPAWVKRAAWERDGGRCAWREADGTVCGSKDWLEYDHLRPFAKGGRSDSPRNVRLLCRAHNAEAARAAGLSAAAPAS